MSTFATTAPAWMTPNAFWPGGLIEQLTDDCVQQLGHGALQQWRSSITQFAKGRAITHALLDAHDRQSPHHYALYRAACQASTAPRVAVRQQATPQTQQSIAPQRRRSTRDVRIDTALRALRLVK